MNIKSVLQIETHTYEEEQCILSNFPKSVWINLDNKTMFYLPYTEYDKVKKIIELRNQKVEGEDGKNEL